MGSNPGHDICVLEQDTLLKLLLFTQGYKWVPARVEVDIVFEKAFGKPQQPGLYTPQGERLQECYWPNDQGTNVKRIETLL